MCTQVVSVACECVCLWGRLWGLEWKVIGCGYEMIGCAWFSDKCSLHPPPPPPSPERVWSVWPPLPASPERMLVCLPHVWGLRPCVCCAAHLHRYWGWNLLTERGLGRSVRTVVSPEGTRCKGTAVQSHPIPPSFPICVSGRVEKMQEGGGRGYSGFTQLVWVIRNALSPCGHSVQTVMVLIIIF